MNRSQRLIDMVELAKRVIPGLYHDTFNKKKYVFRVVEDTKDSDGEWDVFVLDNTKDSDKLDLLGDGNYYSWVERLPTKAKAIKYAKNHSRG